MSNYFAKDSPTVIRNTTGAACDNCTMQFVARVKLTFADDTNIGREVYDEDHDETTVEPIHLCINCAKDLRDKLSEVIVKC